MEVQSMTRFDQDWLSDSFRDFINTSDLDPNSLLFPPFSGSDSSGMHSPIYTDVSEVNSEKGGRDRDGSAPAIGGALVLVRKRKADSVASSSSSKDHSQPEQDEDSKQKKKQRESSQESDPQSNDGEEVVRSGRKGHKKSRQGCFNCKKRKIKCQETKPACDNCTKKNISCMYPPPRTLTALRVPTTYSPNPLASVNVNGTPTTFNMTDMRLFHHYMMEAYPHLPVGNDSTWLSQIPLIAHHNQYLMHALLGMSASHFELVTGEPISSSAHHHRMLAIKGSNEAMSAPRRSGVEADALLAACYLLAFQSAYMRDGLYEFFRTVRGCSLVCDQLKVEKLPMSFHMNNKVHYEFMKPRMSDLPIINDTLIDGAQKSLESLSGHLDLPINGSFKRGLSRVLDAAVISSEEIYYKWMRVFNLVLTMTEEDFNIFIPPTNHIGRILIAHFLAIQVIIGPILDREWMGRKRSTPIRTNLDWIYDVHAMLPPEERPLVEWPRSIAEKVDEELAGTAPAGAVSILRRGEGLRTGVI